MIGTTAFSVDAQSTDTGTTVIAVSGDLDLSVAQLLRTALLDALAEGTPPYVVLDLSRLEFTDSTGLGLIIAGHKRAKSRGGMLVLAAVPPSTAALIRVAGLTRIFPPYATVGDARAALLAGGAACLR
jgi:anti-sigma B factor antagonist